MKNFKNNINTKRIIVVDLYAGSYNEKNTGHELFNLVRNPVDSNFYGYCPPRDGIALTKFGASKNDEYIDNVLVVYVSKKNKSNNREIIAFCLNARIFKTGQSGKGLSRNFIDKDGKEVISTYSVKSDNLYDLRNRFNKFEIKINDYNNKMFRKQRFYCGTYPELDIGIIDYIESVLEQKAILDNDDSDVQEEIQISEPADTEIIKKSSEKPLNIENGNQGKIIVKDSRISKSALIAANYTCSINTIHKTFITKQKIPYMEGHHLIPCTVTNSEYFMKKYNKNIDCIENIVSICPNCHREIHYGEWKSKSEKIKLLFRKQQDKLKQIGILITEDELLKLYKNG
ncbi:MAG: hypothetical protein A2X08_03780 [Bacteroidetes bacterium GWA2_32_17]|nr:MAG: hypothetical protein A2X08_03780 [Bacteroidetes bacterium GWA2_32_17]